MRVLVVETSNGDTEVMSTTTWTPPSSIKTFVRGVVIESLVFVDNATGESNRITYPPVSEWRKQHESLRELRRLSSKLVSDRWAEPGTPPPPAIDPLSSDCDSTIKLTTLNAPVDVVGNDKSMGGTQKNTLPVVFSTYWSKLVARADWFACSSSSSQGSSVFGDTLAKSSKLYSEGVDFSTFDSTLDDLTYDDLAYPEMYQSGDQTTLDLSVVSSFTADYEYYV